jgi:hypothetical protein
MVAVQLTAPAPAGVRLDAVDGRTYYVRPGGSDAHSGTSPQTAWRTVRRVNRARLRPGDRVLFRGRAVFRDRRLTPRHSGRRGAPIQFGAFGGGLPVLAKGVRFKGRHDLSFSDLELRRTHQGILGRGIRIRVARCSIHDVSIALNVFGRGWTIEDNAVRNTGDSALILQGESHAVRRNVISNAGTNTRIPYGKHGVYMKSSSTLVERNVIAGFADSGVSSRKRHGRITSNTIGDGDIGISWFQNDRRGGTSRWTRNVIYGTTAAGIYISPYDSAGPTRERFLITNNVLTRAGGVHLNLKVLEDHVTIAGNSLR